MKVITTARVTMSRTAYHGSPPPGFLSFFIGSGRFGGGLIDISNGFRFTLDGTGAGIQIFPEAYGISIMNLPFGGFLTLGLLIGLMQAALKKSEKKKKSAERAAKEAALQKEVEE